MRDIEGIETVIAHLKPHWAEIEKRNQCAVALKADDLLAPLMAHAPGTRGYAASSLLSRTRTAAKAFANTS
jgi:hypothetical protein